MIYKLVNDINKALDGDAYLAALSLVLTLPDICAKAKYPTDRNKERYVKWYDEYIGKYEHPGYAEDEDDVHNPYLSGEVIYNLRCNVLHQGTPNVDKDKIQEEDNKIDRFILLIEKKKPVEIYGDTSERSTNNWSENVERTYRVNIRRLCFIITTVCKNYYERHKGQFDFFNYEIVDWDEEVKRLNRK